MKEIKVALFGVGGYAANYPYTIAHHPDENVKLVAAVDPFNKDCDLCPVYDTAEEMYQHHQPDLVVVGTPLHLHVEQTVEAFRRGCHVAMEKPMAPDMDGVRQILAARDEAGKMLSVGFNMCADPAIRAARKDAQSGLFGKPVSMKVIVLWPRGHAYYARGGGWAGRKYAKNGAPLFDSVLSNATAHYLMNMLFFLNEPLETIDCRTYRANPIETYDTAIVKGKTASGVDAFIAVTHASDPDKKQNPYLVYEYEKATLTVGGVGAEDTYVTATFKDGTVKEYGREGSFHMGPFWCMIGALRGTDEIACTGEQGMLHVDTIEKMRQIQPDSTAFPAAWLAEKNEYTWVPGLAEAMWDCFHKAELPDWDLTADHLGEG
ncbi:MAG: Gfo/Idh/MocA family oxidoreductase [Clostridia bacterium]|nr:Gfo/Idh/MocA family oxidoreductase [Clostridia bacterium]